MKLIKKWIIIFIVVLQRVAAQERCSQPPFIKYPDDALPPEECSDSVRVLIYYDNDYMDCRKFEFNDCYGKLSDNVFENYDTCMQTCAPKRPGVCPPSLGMPCMKPEEELPPNECIVDVQCVDPTLKCCPDVCNRKCKPPWNFNIVKPGSCPTLDYSGPFPVCARPTDEIMASWCLEDSSCPGNQKCCLGYCGPTCLDPVSVNPGACPVSTVECSEIKVGCSSDTECDPDLKCCLVDCVQSCVKPINIVKPGSCPILDYREIFPRCVMPAADIMASWCLGDSSCPGNQKCCPGYCGPVCLDPDPLQKPGVCPRNDDVITTCELPAKNGCQTDSNCPDDLKCCTVGCNLQCTKPAEIPVITDICQLGPVEPGGDECDGAFIRYTYDPELKDCKSYTYGGCGGTKNLFNSIEECRKTCVLKIITPPVDICKLGPIEDIDCDTYSERFAYDPSTGQCISYRTCLETKNLFLTFEDCVENCIIYRSSDKEAGNAGNDDDESASSVCQLGPIKAGQSNVCKARFPKFTYDSATGICKSYIYGGCHGTGNLFDKIDECIKTCGGSAPPTPKPGRCPPVEKMMTSESPCGIDYQCRDDLKCCSNGKVKYCVKPYVNKAGKCPTPTGAGICVNLCSGDSDCEGKLKCCSNGCGTTCQDPFIKAGRCPRASSLRTCSTQCYSDGFCNGARKCCKATCIGRSGSFSKCAKPLPTKKPGRCPRWRYRNYYRTIPPCKNDYECKRNFKCCPPGNKCVPPV